MSSKFGKFGRTEGSTLVFLVGARKGAKMTGNSNVAKTGKTPFHVDTLQEGTPAAVQRTKQISAWVIEPVITQVRPAVAL